MVVPRSLVDAARYHRGEWRIRIPGGAVACAPEDDVRGRAPRDGDLASARRWPGSWRPQWLQAWARSWDR